MSMYSITPQHAVDKIRNRIDLHSTSPFLLSLAALEQYQFTRDDVIEVYQKFKHKMMG